MPRGYDLSNTFALGTGVIEAMFVPVPISGEQLQLRRLRVGCPQSAIPPQQCLAITINILCGASGGTGGTTAAATPMKHDPGDSPSVASGLCQLGNTTPNSGGIITDTYTGADYLWIGDEIVFPNPPIVPNGYAIQVLIGAQSTSPTPVPSVTTWLEWTETGGPPAMIAPPYYPINPVLPVTITANPVVSSVSPNFGCVAGGISVTILGANFTGATQVLFGGTPAFGFIVDSATQIVAIDSAQASGTVDITVTTPTGTSVAGTYDKFTYQSMPTVTAVSPPAGGTAGGTTVTIGGSGFLGATTVMFGVTGATTFTVTSSTMIVAVSPAESAGTVDVTVTTACGTSATATADRFTYIAPVAYTGPVSGTGNGAQTLEGTLTSSVSLSLPIVWSGATTTGSTLVLAVALSNTASLATPAGFTVLEAPANDVGNGGSTTLYTFVAENAASQTNVSLVVSATGTWTLVAVGTEVLGAAVSSVDLGSVTSNVSFGATAFVGYPIVAAPQEAGIAVVFVEGASSIGWNLPYNLIITGTGSGAFGQLSIAWYGGYTSTGLFPGIYTANTSGVSIGAFVLIS